MRPESRLYQVPPSEFVEARDALVAELLARGEREQAAAVKALRKPNVVLWAANQLARRAPAAVRALLDAAVVMRGAVGPELREASRAEREQLAALVREGERALGDGGHPTGASTARQLYALLHAAAAGNAETRAALAEGRLAAAPEAPTALGPTVTPAPPKRPTDEDRERERAAEVARERERAREREQALREAKKLRAIADKLTERATAARARADEAARTAAAAERAAEEAREAADKAARAV